MIISAIYTLRPEPGQAKDTFDWEVLRFLKEVELMNRLQPIPWVIKVVIEGGKSPDFQIPSTTASASPPPSPSSGPNDPNTQQPA